MSKARAFSSPELAPPSINHHEMPEDYCLEGDSYFVNVNRYFMLSKSMTCIYMVA
jgi:hypothetical protein